MLYFGVAFVASLVGGSAFVMTSLKRRNDYISPEDRYYTLDRFLK